MSGLYWDSPNVTQFLRNQKEPIQIAKATGCAFGLTAISGPLRSKPMSKSWYIKGTLPTIVEFLDRECECEPNMKHAPAEGANTAHSGRYTSAFVAAVHKAFAKVANNVTSTNSIEPECM